jgi:hypothetical protein
MMKPSLAVAVAVFAVMFGVTQPVMAHDHFGAHLSGVQEVPAIFSDGHGFALVTLNDAQDALTYTLVYFEITNTVTEAHIHFGRPGVEGGIIAFLCSNLLGAPPGVPGCPNGGGGPVPIPGFNSVTGTITAANVGTGAASQGIGAGDFAGLIEALESSSTYVNVHTNVFPAGEIRGPLGH